MNELCPMPGCRVEAITPDGPDLLHVDARGTRLTCLRLGAGSMSVYGRDGSTAATPDAPGASLPNACRNWSRPMRAGPLGWPRRKARSVRHWAARQQQGCCITWPCRPAPTRCCASSAAAIACAGNAASRGRGRLGAPQGTHLRDDRGGLGAPARDRHAAGPHQHDGRGLAATAARDRGLPASPNRGTRSLDGVSLRRRHRRAQGSRGGGSLALADQRARRAGTLAGPRPCSPAAPTGAARRRQALSSTAHPGVSPQQHGGGRQC